tara:strand:- start:1116 stop:1487 length:372 start_codon:yes stop_codon:yes gene_type:complete
MKQNLQVEPADIFDGLLAGQGGWDSQELGNAGLPVNSVMKGDLDEIAALAEAVFSGPAGEKLLDYLMSQTVRMATWPGDLMMPRDALVNYGCYREGQNSIVVLLCALAGRGRQLLEEGDPQDE